MKQNEETTATQKKNVVNKNGLEFVIVEIPRTKKKYRIGTLQNSQLDAMAKLLIGKDGQDHGAFFPPRSSRTSSRTSAGADCDQRSETAEMRRA